MATGYKFHTIGVLHFFVTLLYDLFYLKVGNESREYSVLTGRLKFLTFWNVIIQAVFFTICLVNDVIGTNEDDPPKKPTIRVIKDTMLAAVAFPLSMLVGLTFWILYAIDRELIFPRALDEFFPSWLNHAMHTNIMFFILIEMFLSFRKYPQRKIGFGIFTSVLLVYLIWIHIINAYSGIWVYPILSVLNLPLRLTFFIVMIFLSYGVYVLGEKLNSLIWANKLEVVIKKA